jgi:hypothetical protein
MAMKVTLTVELARGSFDPWKLNDVVGALDEGPGMEWDYIDCGHAAMVLATVEASSFERGAQRIEEELRAGYPELRPERIYEGTAVPGLGHDLGAVRTWARGKRP